MHADGHALAEGQPAVEPVGNQPSGRLPTVEYRFRNGSRVNFKAYRIRMATLLKDVKAYIRSHPRRLDRRKVEINNIGWRLVHENQTRYIGKKTAERIMFQLRDKLDMTMVSTSVPLVSDVDADVIDFLTGLGFSIVEAQSALQNIPRDVSGIDDRLQMALQYLDQG